MTGPELLAAEVGILHTAVGACWPGTRAVYRGHDLHRDLHGIDWIELYAFGITGRRFRAEEVRLLHGIWATTSYPDTRLWNNRVGAMAGNARSSPGLGLAASIAVSEAGIYGGGPGIRAIDFFLRAGQAINEGVSIREFVFQELGARRILGYGRPINSTDERLPPLIRLVESLGLDQGIHYRLAFAVENILITEHKPFLKMNYAALTAALAADLGFTPRQYQLFNNLKFVAGMPPCILEAAEKPAGTLFPTRCSDIDYQGQASRNWPASTIPSNIVAQNPGHSPISKDAAHTT